MQPYRLTVYVSPDGMMHKKTDAPRYSAFYCLACPGETLDKMTIERKLE